MELFQVLKLFLFKRRPDIHDRLLRMLVDISDSCGIRVNLALKVLNFYQLIIDLKAILANFSREVINLIL